MAAVNYLSVCSGIESASVAWKPLGWTCVGVAEVEPFPCSVLTHRFGASRPMFMPDPDDAPDDKARRARRAAIKTISRLPEKGRITNYGDITRFREWTGVPRFGLLVGGTPCQSFSVAGLRQGLADPRGNLMLTYLAIAAEYRPEWLVWENVPGVLSADDGRAFGTLVKGMEELGYHAAWRVLDAQYVRVDQFGRAVPQRRRRVFVVGHLGDWRRAAGVLFDAESLRGNSPPRREARERVAVGVGESVESGGDVAHALRAKSNLAHREDADTLVSHAVTSKWAKGSGGPSCDEAQNLVAVAGVAASLTQGANSSGKGGYAGRRQEDDVMWRLDSGAILEEPHDTANIRAASGGSSRSYLAFDAYNQSAADVAHTLRSGDGSGKGDAVPQVCDGWAVRRLMPVECERLQGFPDGWTNVPYRGRNTTPDGPRYRAIGNSKAVNVVRWIGRRIDMVNRDFG